MTAAAIAIPADAISAGPTRKQMEAAEVESLEFPFARPSCAQPAARPRGSCLLNAPCWPWRRPVTTTSSGAPGVAVPTDSRSPRPRRPGGVGGRRLRCSRRSRARASGAGEVGAAVTVPALAPLAGRAGCGLHRARRRLSLVRAPRCNAVVDSSLRDTRMDAGNTRAWPWRCDPSPLREGRSTGTAAR